MDDKKRIWIIVGAGCTVALVGLCCIGAVGIYTGADRVMSAWNQAGETAEGFLKDLREGRIENAYARMAPEYQQDKDLEAFRLDVAGTPDLLEHTGAIVQERHFGSEGVRITGLLATPRGTVRFGLLLDKYDDELRVLGVQVDEAQRPGPDLGPGAAPDILPDAESPPAPDSEAAAE